MQYRFIKYPIKLAFLLLDVVLTLFALPVLLIHSLIFRSKNTDALAIGWGPTPLKPIRYNSMALNSIGVKSYTFVDGLYPINNSNDFDFHLYSNSTLLLSRLLPSLFRTFFFMNFLEKCNVLVTNFDGGLLRDSFLKHFEHFFIKLSKKNLVVWPYGSDSFIYSKISDHSFRYGLYKSYPDAAKKEFQIQNQINYFINHSDLVIGNIPHHEALPRWDVLTVACYCVDVQEWSPSEDYYQNSDGKMSVVKIFHCPNHRDVKGTNFIIQAVSELKSEGLKIELNILEGVKNEEILNQMKYCDIVIAQLLYGYASTEIEAMSLAKPVISNLNFKNYYDAASNFTYFRECPLVSASPIELKDQLRRLVVSPELRSELGVRGRNYVSKYHSLAGQGAFWKRVGEVARGASSQSLANWWHES